MSRRGKSRWFWRELVGIFGGKLFFTFSNFSINFPPEWAIPSSTTDSIRVDKASTASHDTRPIRALPFSAPNRRWTFPTTFRRQIRWDIFFLLHLFCLCTHLRMPWNSKFHCKFPSVIHAPPQLDHVQRLISHRVIWPQRAKPAQHVIIDRVRSSLVLVPFHRWRKFIAAAPRLILTTGQQLQWWWRHFQRRRRRRLFANLESGSVVRRVESSQLPDESTKADHANPVAVDWDTVHRESQSSFNSGDLKRAREA